MDGIGCLNKKARSLTGLKKTLRCAVDDSLLSNSLGISGITMYPLTLSLSFLRVAAAASDEHPRNDSAETK